MDIVSHRKIRFIYSVLVSALLMFSFGLREAISEDFSGEYRPSALTLIKAKSKNAVMTAVGRFSVTSDSEILDIKGNPLNIRDLPVPCVAKVRSEPGRHGGDPKAVRIQIQEILQGATTEWKAQSPE